jgi:GxxExxY protein
VFGPISDEVEEIVSVVIDAAIKVHSALGPGLLESVYEACLCHELSLREVSFERQLALPVTYRGMQLESGLRLDLFVASEVIVELKSVDKLMAIHEAQALTYLKLSNRRVCLLMNFNSIKLKDGLRRIVR